MMRDVSAACSVYRVKITREILAMPCAKSTTKDSEKFQMPRMQKKELVYLTDARILIYIGLYDHKGNSQRKEI